VEELLLVAKELEDFRMLLAEVDAKLLETLGVKVSSYVVLSWSFVGIVGPFNEFSTGSKGAPSPALMKSPTPWVVVLSAEYDDGVVLGILDEGLLELLSLVDIRDEL